MSFGDDIAVWLPQLRRYARALTGDAAWADDLVQDTAERAIVQGKRLPAGSQARAWMLTVLRHLYIDQLRRRREVAVDAADPLWQRQAVRASEIDGLLLRDVQRALYRLPVEQREVLLLVVLEGLRYQEAAVVLQVPLGTVMSRLSRAREHLRALLADGAGGSGGSGGTGGAGGTGGTDGTGERHVPLRVVRNTP
ncbi:ECF subfamily RNA polymerase sigma-24 factor [Cupriavidus basilensis OR16]|uniref:ECF subfamily RNA polymerase sigma-24 factor n=1 Tax=Cupriavidus basilensis OR16 TaxID=1127483 RepID=H1S516_9BURK|nr:sigma-70 family RNA polymerase sigma factor [Cupriavidus basilensis]EHP42367.1 ECF subfamily RNA polymerase sigma-24 factor [Cupriavidus basilensis OR16]